MADAKTSGLDRWKALISRIPAAIVPDLQAELDAEADELMDGMKEVVRVKSGDTEKSIRKEPGLHDLSVVVRAGGPLTTKPVRNGASTQYDYALAEEYGTKHAPPHPFFWPVYRAKKAAFRRRRAAIAKKAIEGAVQ